VFNRFFKRPKYRIKVGPKLGGCYIWNRAQVRCLWFFWYELDYHTEYNAAVDTIHRHAGRGQNAKRITYFNFKGLPYEN
jgi:hypothetical protein